MPTKSGQTNSSSAPGALLEESVTRVSGARAFAPESGATGGARARSAARPRSFWRLPDAHAGRRCSRRGGGRRCRAHHAAREESARSPGSEGGQAYEDIEMLSDNDGLELIENFDGSFYEWAAAQGEEGDSGASG